MRTSVRNVHLVFLEESRSVWLSWLVEVSTGCYAASIVFTRIEGIRKRGVLQTAGAGDDQRRAEATFLENPAAQRASHRRYPADIGRRHRAQAARRPA
jgi:hypothetical protein